MDNNTKIHAFNNAVRKSRTFLDMAELLLNFGLPGYALGIALTLLGFFVANPMILSPMTLSGLVMMGSCSVLFALSEIFFRRSRYWLSVATNLKK